MRIKLVHRKIGTQHVFTSPDVPELFVAHANKSIARASIPDALKMLQRMKARLDARQAVIAVQSERLTA